MTVNEKRVIGFDFGTTNSLISQVRMDAVINFLDEEGRPIPSLVCYEGGAKILGRKAKEHLSHAGLGIQGNVIRSPKMYLGKDLIFVQGIEKNPVDVVADVVSFVYEQAKQNAVELGDIAGAVVTIPVDMKGFQRKALREAFNIAGLKIIQFVHEPLAALYGYFRENDAQQMLRRYNNKLLLVFDWGGGTLDLTLCRPIENTLVQLINDGTDEVGGDSFDQIIKQSLVKKIIIERAMDEDIELHPGAEARLIDRCERAKIDLSSRDDALIYVDSYFRHDHDDFDYTLTQTEMESIISPLLEKGIKRIERILDSAGFQSEEVALCLATGGMSNMPAVKRRLYEWFGPERVHIPESTQTIIAEGAAWIAHDHAKLALAKNVELNMSRNSWLPLIKAGTAMPDRGQDRTLDFHLYCTDPRDGIAKFQLCSPIRAGSQVMPNDPRIILNNLTVEVDSAAKPFHERLELDITVDENLILEAYARSLNKKDQSKCEIHNIEFGISFPEIGNTPDPDSGIKDDNNPKDYEVSIGALAIRANVHDRIDKTLIPGELLYSYEPSYFDTRLEPPKEQVLERLYYEPCSICKKPSNDPACHCASTL